MYSVLCGDASWTMYSLSQGVYGMIANSKRGFVSLLTHHMVSICTIDIDFMKVNLLLINILICPFKFIYSMLPHCHNGPFIFLVVLNSETLTRKLRAP